jgi:hypothetical protein
MLCLQGRAPSPLGKSFIAGNASSDDDDQQQLAQLALRSSSTADGTLAPEPSSSAATPFDVEDLFYLPGAIGVKLVKPRQQQQQQYQPEQPEQLLLASDVLKMPSYPWETPAVQDSYMDRSFTMSYEKLKVRAGVCPLRAAAVCCSVAVSIIRPE